MAVANVAQSVAEINAEKPFATKITTSASSQSIDLSTIAMPLGTPASKCANAAGISQPLLVLQCDQDFYYMLGVTGATITLPAGSTPGVFVRAGDQEYVRPASMPGRTFLYVLQATAAGVLRVYVSRPASGS